MRKDKIIYQPIGVIHSPFNEIKGMPIQPSGAGGIKGTIEIKKIFVPGLKDLNRFSHIILIYHFHLAKGFSLEVIPFLDKTSRGLFATRASKRPNSIGISLVKLLKIKENKLFVENIDVVEGTPLLDIKPYVRDYDYAANTRSGWLTNVSSKSKKIKSDTRFK